MMRNNYMVFFLIFVCHFGYAQVQLVVDINTTTPTASSSPRSLIVFDDRIYFTASDGINGSELWSSDGTLEGTLLVSDINNGGSSAPNGFFEYNNALYFSANGGGGSVLHTTDGTEAGTVDLGLGALALSPVPLNALVYAVNSTAGNRLYEFNGTTMVEVADNGAGEETIIAGNTVAYDNRIFCYMNYSTEDAMFGNELYAYDPESDTFSLISDINVGEGDSSISNFAVLDAILYFEAESALWQTDGTDAGTTAVAIANTISGVNNVYAWDGQLFFEGDDGSGDQLWVYNPIADTVTNLSTIAGDNSNHDPSDYAPYEGWLYYRGEDSNDSSGHLWRTDGTIIEQLDDTVADIDDIVAYNGFLFFEGDNGSGNELFFFDPNTLSIDVFGENGNVYMYPNPTNGIILFSEHMIDASYVISDLSGRTIAEGILDKNEITIQQASGIYVLTLIKDQKRITKKIIIR